MTVWSNAIYPRVPVVILEQERASLPLVDVRCRLFRLHTRTFLPSVHFIDSFFSSLQRILFDLLDYGQRECLNTIATTAIHI